MPRSRSPYICTSCGLCSSGDPDTPRLGRPGKRRVGRRKADGGAGGPVGGTANGRRGVSRAGEDCVTLSWWTHDLVPPCKPAEQVTPAVTPLSVTGSVGSRRGPRGGRGWDGLCACQGTEPEGQRRAAPRLFLGTWGAVRSEVFFFFSFSCCCLWPPGHGRFHGPYDGRAALVLGTGQRGPRLKPLTAFAKGGDGGRCSVFLRDTGNFGLLSGLRHLGKS